CPAAAGQCCQDGRRRVNPNDECLMTNDEGNPKHERLTTTTTKRCSFSQTANESSFPQEVVCFRGEQSQRDCVLQPRVARNELPWVGGRTLSNPERVPPSMFATFRVDNPHCEPPSELNPHDSTDSPNGLQVSESRSVSIPVLTVTAMLALMFL